MISRLSVSFDRVKANKYKWISYFSVFSFVLFSSIFMIEMQEDESAKQSFEAQTPNTLKVKFKQFLHTGGIPHGTKRVKPFALFHVTFRETQKCVGFLSISAETWWPLSLKILLDEITLETYDRPGSKKYFAKLFIGLCS